MRTPTAYVATLVLGFAAFGLGKSLQAPRALAADCSQGAVYERVACLSQEVGALETKVAELSKQLEAKADAADALKWNDRIALRNEDMVEGLAARLDQQGDDLPGWLKLVRAYSVLDRKDDAQKALARAKSQFSGNTQAIEQLDALAAELGLKS